MVKILNIEKISYLTFIIEGTNDAYVSISLGEEKFQTRVKKNTIDVVEWMQQLDL